ncbi:hypothetical protein Dfer_0958 [Dyadobacter fermentans DSM 18053]|uniref:Uncharacterized protein n=1 Tax=Dyadobacter fermentans (strain ATCC 700827 / DSM 18053 / CIP 107007 / KCTC 52180 / NS114) TaxID=471854 RepID=C6W3A5_DYAFD|nr:hypothetical protein Dfer_0958 [Dyadobacter fermentans DSM 18053]
MKVTWMVWLPNRGLESMRRLYQVRKDFFDNGFYGDPVTEN